MKGVKIAVAIEDLLAGDGGDAVAGDNDAREIDGIGSGDGDDGGTVAGADWKNPAASGWPGRARAGKCAAGSAT